MNPERKTDASPSVAEPALRVLCAHSDPEARVLLQVGLPLDADIAVDLVQSGVDAVVAATSGSYDAILLDEDLEDLSWFDVCEWLAADEDASRLPVLLMTTAAFSGYRFHKLVTALVGQPFTPRLLALQLRAATTVRATAPAHR